jgi:hypothetical protein
MHLSLAIAFISVLNEMRGLMQSTQAVPWLPKFEKSSRDICEKKGGGYNGSCGPRNCQRLGYQADALTYLTNHRGPLAPV